VAAAAEQVAAAVKLGGSRARWLRLRSKAAADAEPEIVAAKQEIFVGCMGLAARLWTPSQPFFSKQQTVQHISKRYTMLGNLINIAAILFGCLMGKLFGNRLNESFRDAAVKAAGLCLLILGAQMALGGKQFILMLLSVVIGSILGEAMDIDGAMERFGKKVEEKVAAGSDGFSKAFVYSTLLFCIGPMSIMGSIAGALRDEHGILITKAVLDGIFSAILTVTMGIGVIGSAVTTGVYQGAIVLGARWVEQYLTEAIVTEMTATGGLLILAIGLNMLKIKEFKTANMLPSLLLICLFVAIWP
jgi:uncharacterized membrane protein YqgA involved in biofilm formation